MRLSQRSPLRLGEICEIFRPGGGDEAELDATSASKLVGLQKLG